MRQPKSRKLKLQRRQSESAEIETLESWIESGKPESGSNPLSLSRPPEKSRVGRLEDGSFSPYAGANKFIQLPLSKKTKDGLKACKKFKKMTDIQRASLPHSLCGRDILGAAKTGSGKTLAFVIPVLEKLYRARWEPEAGVGCIIMSPTRELANQLFEVLKSVGKFHGFSAGLLIGGRKDVDTEKERVNELNILVCTPGRLLQHMDETPNFDCSQLQILVLDEADRILDSGFKKEVNAIISQLPRHRQTLLFSATQTKSVQDLARLSLKDPEYLSVHEESTTATPSRLEQKAVIIPLDRKLDVLWSFIKANLNSRILVFLTTRKQVKFVFEAFKKLRPGIPLMCLHQKSSQDKRMATYSYFCEKRSVLIATDVVARGLDFNQKVDWVVQVDCPDDVASYIHRAGRTARYLSKGRSVLFLAPSETKMLDKLQEKKIPIKCIKDFLSKANNKKFQPVSGLLAALLVKYPYIRELAEKAVKTYLTSIVKQRDKEVFDVTKLPIDDFAASYGLPTTPYVSVKQGKGKKSSKVTIVQGNNNNNTAMERPSESLRASSESDVRESEKADLLAEDTFLQEKDSEHIDQENPSNVGDATPGTRILKKKKLKINMHRPLGMRVVFDEEGNSLPPLAKLAMPVDESSKLDVDKVSQRYAELREEMKIVDKEDKALDRQRRKEKRTKEKMKMKRNREAEEDEEEEHGDITSGDEEEGVTNTKQVSKKAKINFDRDDKVVGLGSGAKAITLAEQEELALKLLSSMHSYD